MIVAFHRSTSMTRDEKERRVQIEDGKAFETYNIEIHVMYLNPMYTLARDVSHAISRTGLLKVFELKPSHNGPSFVGRWDGGSRGSGKQERFDLDIDIQGASDDDKRRFEKGEGSYAGHHTMRSDSDRGWKYQVCIRTLEGLIFEGNVCFNLHRKVGVSETLHLSDAAEATIIRAQK
jgi:hypothetical protein